MQQPFACTHTCICVFPHPLCVCVYTYVLREGEGERERESQRERDTDSEREGERKGEREREGGRWTQSFSDGFAQSDCAEETVTLGHLPGGTCQPPRSSTPTLNFESCTVLEGAPQGSNPISPFDMQRSFLLCGPT